MELTIRVSIDVEGQMIPVLEIIEENPSNQRLIALYLKELFDNIDKAGIEFKFKETM